MHVPEQRELPARDVVVVGGGIVGLSVAWRAARAGLTVTVLDPSPGDGATHAAAGMLAAVTEADFGEEHLTRLNLASAARWPAFAADLAAASGQDVGLQRRGTLAVAYDRDDLAVLRRVLALHRRWGLASAEVPVAEARRREPFLGPRLAGAALVDGDRAVDPRAVHAALTRALVHADGRAGSRAGGGALVRRAAVRLEQDHAGRVVAVHDDAGGRHTAGAVVLATGTPRDDTLLDGVPGVRLPVRPVKGLTLRLDAGPGLTPEHVVRGIVQGRPVYVVPRPAGTGTGPGSGPEHREVVVGATSDERPDDRRAEAGSVFSLLRDARALVPGLDEAALVDVTPRARPATPDNLPLIGATAVPGLLAATGHGRNGVLLAPLTADAVLAALTDGGVPLRLPADAPADLLGAADPRRFATTTRRAPEGAPA
ncbi:glycine oxidase ThiO [Isoptericola sp. NEAU-Y5]|uniref:glycine oxidase n=1 Tax=Isoptericola luteus TaxID=2879484 RepID=A0ABS7ZDQ3_9MICO|nr:glycine oxidase ThiO [Isoptericola sp. NEAU-Y5]MCA5892587.1 glycine oxidase ThiO [Isoptericola sp. NEAU-Y5]